MRTHYDNLKVSMDAPIEVIQAAYRTLAKKYHPDKNQSDPDAERIMQIINTAYEVLSDPVKREEHDSWIRKENWRSKVESEKKTSAARQKTPKEPSSAPNVKARGKARILNPEAKFAAKKMLVSTLKTIGYYGIIVGVIIGVIKIFATQSPNENAIAETSYPASIIIPEDLKLPELSSNCAGKQASYPDGRAWSSSAKVITTRDKRRGLSSLLLDNSRNDQDLYIKLVLVKDELTRNYARDAFIPARKQLKLLNVASGSYVVKMMNIADGCSQVSPVIDLTETRTDRGIEYSEHSLTFYPVINGNIHLRSIPSSQF